MCSISSITSKKYEIIPKLTDYLSTSAENVLKSTFARIPSYLVEKYRSPKTPVFNRLFGLPASGNCLLYIYKILWSQAFWQASISLHFALQFCIPTWTTPPPVFQTISWIFYSYTLVQSRNQEMEWYRKTIQPFV